MLPYDIDGHCRYLLHCDPTPLMSSSKDGRPWKPYISSSRKGFSGKRIADCKGSLICSNLQCPYFQKFKNFNTVQFESSGLEQVCSCCDRWPITVLVRLGKYGNLKMAIMQLVLLLIMKGNTLALL